MHALTRGGSCPQLGLIDGSVGSHESASPRNRLTYSPRTSSLNFYRLDALPVTNQVSEH